MLLFTLLFCSPVFAEKPIESGTTSPGTTISWHQKLVNYVHDLFLDLFGDDTTATAEESIDSNDEIKQYWGGPDPGTRKIKTAVMRDDGWSEDF
jgi:hypothetical protein